MFVALDRQTILQEEVTCPRCLGVLLRVHEELKEGQQ
jgi:ribosomal protein S27AE